MGEPEVRARKIVTSGFPNRQSAGCVSDDGRIGLTRLSA